MWLVVQLSAVSWRVLHMLKCRRCKGEYNKMPWIDAQPVVDYVLVSVYSHFHCSTDKLYWHIDGQNVLRCTYFDIERYKRCVVSTYVPAHCKLILQSRGLEDMLNHSTDCRESECIAET